MSYLPHLAKIYRLAAPLPRSFKICSLREFARVLEEGSLLCPFQTLKSVFRAYEVCSVSCVIFCFSSITRQMSKNAVLFFLRGVISGAGAVHWDVVTPLRAHSVRGVATLTFFLQN